jgi:hypothetical protein
MDSSALQAILAVSQAAAIDGGALALVNPQRAVSTALNLTQADQLLAVYASMAEASIATGVPATMAEAAVFRAAGGAAGLRLGRNGP